MPNLILLGNLNLERLPIFSFLIKNDDTGLYLHYNFVTKLLNDMFGIQSRSGCACAGPYGHYLLGIDDQLGEKYRNQLLAKDDSSVRPNDYVSARMDSLKPGFTRFNIPFFLNDTQVDYILHAVEFVAQHGWKFLPLYEFQADTGKFWHCDSNNHKHGLKIDMDFDSILNKRNETHPENYHHNFDAATLQKYLADADNSLNSLDSIYKAKSFIFFIWITNSVLVSFKLDFFSFFS